MQRGWSCAVAVGITISGALALGVPRANAQVPMGEAALAAYHTQLANSPLRQQAVAAGGELVQMRTVNQANLAASVTSMAQSSDEVLLVHIIRNSCQLSPSGSQPITMYQAYVIRSWKGHSAGDTITFAVPMGMVVFDQQTRAVTRISGFHGISNGKRYVLFLRYSRGTEQQLLPALQLVGDGIQGAFEIRDEKIYAAYAGSTVAAVQAQAQTGTFTAPVAMARSYSAKSVSQFTAELNALFPVQKP